MLWEVERNNLNTYQYKQPFGTMKKVSLMLMVLVFAITTANAVEPNDTVASVKTAQSVEQRIIRGSVFDRKGQPIIGATVKVKDNVTKNAVTDVDGNFTIKDAPSNGILQVSYIGFMPQEIEITPVKDDYTIVMRINHSLLDEVVVVGYATQKKLI